MLPFAKDWKLNISFSFCTYIALQNFKIYIIFIIPFVLYISTFLFPDNVESELQRLSWGEARRNCSSFLPFMLLPIILVILLSSLYFVAVHNKMCQIKNLKLSNFVCFLFFCSTFQFSLLLSDGMNEMSKSFLNILLKLNLLQFTGRSRFLWCRQEHTSLPIYMQFW